MEYTAEQLLENWNEFTENIVTYISEPRKTQLLDFYKRVEDRVIIAPASPKAKYHSCFPGGYVHHVNNVVRISLNLYEVWEKMGMDTSSFTIEEMVFSAINHDLGKIGDKDNDSYIPSTDQWRKEKLGEMYSFNTQLDFISVPDRSLFLLQEAGIQTTVNEMISIKVHDGLYDEANIKYFKSYIPETKFRSALPILLHHADMMATRIEFEQQIMPTFNLTSKDNVDTQKKPFTLTTNKKSAKTSDKALKTVKSKKLNSAFKDMFDKIKDEKE